MLGQKLDKKNDQQHYLTVLVQERERCERLYHDNPKDWNERKYLNRIKKQHQWVESKADIVTGKQIGRAHV